MPDLKLRDGALLAAGFLRRAAVAVAFAIAAVLPAGAQLSSLDLKPPDVSAQSYMLMDFLTGETIAELNPDQKLPPASLTKMMTTYLVFSALHEGRLAQDQPVPVSERAWRMSGSRTFIEAGDLVPVSDLLLGVIVQSGNDASVALAEAIAGSVESFVDLMNQQAELLGMKNTRFSNPTGLPADGHYSTARDMAILSRRTIVDFPELYRLYAVREHTFNDIAQRNRNGLLDKYPGSDGLKTGYTKEAGYCLASSAQRGEMRLVSVVMKTPSVRQRERDSIALLNFGFSNYRSVALFKKSPVLQELRIWGGVADFVPAGVSEAPIAVLVPRNNKKIAAEVRPVEPLQAPLRKGDPVGQVKVLLGDEILFSEKLVLLEDVEEAGWVKRARDYIKLNFLGGK